MLSSIWIWLPKVIFYTGSGHAILLLGQVRFYFDDGRQRTLLARPTFEMEEGNIARLSWQPRTQYPSLDLAQPLTY